MKTFSIERPGTPLVLLMTILFCFGLGLGVAGAIERKMLQGAHGQKSIMPKNCRSCHVGMTMALSGEEGPCLGCHGDASAQATMVERGFLRARGNYTLGDIAAELRKPYNHPVLTTRGVHQQFEALPEEVANAARHAECVDCHDPHVADKDRPFAGIKGRRVGNFIADIENEYELCYKCHSDSANLPGHSTNKHAEFKNTNPSFHPVEDEGRRVFVVSLVKPYAGREEKPGDVSRITCTDCHGSDDPAAPRGPHGSSYAGLLRLNYQMSDELPESENAYALCYKCHERRSILSNESFPYHRQHIQGNGVGSSGTSCFTCHDAHGSTQYPSLIRFDESVVSPNLQEKLKFDAQGFSARHGACYLNCHGVEHNPKEY